jgi:hypothetical protein
LSVVERKMDELAVRPTHGEPRLFDNQKGALRFPMGNRYPVLHLTQGLDVPMVLLGRRSQRVTRRFEGHRAERAARGKQVFPLAGERGRRHPKMGYLSENRVRWSADLTEAVTALRAQGK